MRLSPRTYMVMAHDLVASMAAWMIAFWLRFNLEIPSEFLQAALQSLIWVVPLQALIFWRFGLYRGLWRFASLPDMQRIIAAAGVAALAVPMVILLFRVPYVIPRSVLLLDPILLVIIMGGSRLAYRGWKEHRLSVTGLHRKPVLVIGAGRAADNLLRDMARSDSAWRAVGVLDADPDMYGRHLYGVPVLGSMDDVAQWAEKLAVDDVILAIPAATHQVRKQITRACTNAGLNLLTVPSLEDLMTGRVAVSQLRPIELDELLGRDPVKLDDAGLHQFLAGRTVLVTGAGGSIGSELCRQIARYHPARLVLLENSELALYQMEQEFRADHPEQSIACLIADVRDQARIRDIMSVQRPHVVFHAAAYKHVPLMEEHNALQALKNNVHGTWVMASAAREAGVEKFVMVSTDKAVNPTNVMGASKRLAEMVCQALQAAGGTRFVSVRFGNVLGSSGSVIPKFQAQIAAGGPITVTHPEINRYFMSIPEASQLVLQAGLMGVGGEIFVLDMGEPVKIADLARLMIRLAGKTEEEIQIVYSGLRPGEKLYEELLTDTETSLPTPHPKLRIARARQVEGGQVEEMLEWITSTHVSNDAAVRAQLRSWVPEYRPEQQ